MIKSARTLFNYLIISSFLFCNSSYSMDSDMLEQQANQSIEALYHRVNSKPNISMIDRITMISGYFKGRPYILGSLGEGATARYDQFPRYRVDGFDCETYVTTVLALAMGNSLASFQQCLKFTRYHNGIVSYLNRNHFTSVDWNANNQQRGLLKDITGTIVDKKGQSVALIAHALINKPGWYAHKTSDVIRLQKSSAAEQSARLLELKAKGKTLKTVRSEVPYLPFTALFSNENKPNMFLFSQIPQAAIIEIVRPDWDLRQQIGTALNISHLGFAVWIDGQLYFREASSVENKVVDVPLIDYLLQARNSPTIKGINVQVVLPKQPVLGDCQFL